LLVAVCLVQQHLIHYARLLLVILCECSILRLKLLLVLSVELIKFLSVH
jgi:hypothetical protein